MKLQLVGLFLLFAFDVAAAPLPPLVCPAGGALGAVDLRVLSPRGTSEPLSLRNINRLEEGDSLTYRPLLRSGEERHGEVTLVLVPANKSAAGEPLRVLEPKPAGKPEEWQVPWRVGVVAFVYGPAGLNTKKVRAFLSRDEELVAQLADYAEKTQHTEALLAALSSPTSSEASVQAALRGFSSQYGLAAMDRGLPADQQAITLVRAMNPTAAAYDPLSPQANAQVQFGQTASLATTVATLFFGSPVGLAAGGTAMVLQIRDVAFPRAEFRSSFSQPMPDGGLGLCGSRSPAPPHTHVAYLWATRIPNAAPPKLAIEKANYLPAALKSPLPLNASESDWKYIQRAHSWVLEPESGKPIPIKVLKLGDTKNLELDLPHAVKPGKYTLAASWDWDPFQVKGSVEIKALTDFASVHPNAASQDLLVAKTGKVPVTLEGSDFEFVTKAEIEKLNDKFATPVPVPFVLPRGPRLGPQERMDIQINTIDLDPGEYRLSLTQVDGKARPVELKILAAPPRIESLPVILNQGTTTGEFTLKGRRLNLLVRMEVAGAETELAPATADQTERVLRLHMKRALAAGTSLAMKAFIQDRSEPLILSDAVRIVGPLPSITSAHVSQPVDQRVELSIGELPGGVYLSALLRVQHLQSNSTVRLDCEQPGSSAITLRLGQRSGPLSLQQLAPDQVFLSFDSSIWSSGCILQASISNGSEGESDPYKLGRLVRVPEIDRLDLPTDEGDQVDTRPATVTGQNLETIEKAGWSSEKGQPVDGLPVPITGGGDKQTLRLHIGPKPEDNAPLFIWLRGETSPRLARLGS